MLCDWVNQINLSVLSLAVKRQPTKWFMRNEEHQMQITMITWVLRNFNDCIQSQWGRAMRKVSAHLNFNRQTISSKTKIL